MINNEITPAYPLGTTDDIETSLKSIPYAATQQRRLVKFLLSNQAASTVQVSQRCAIGNISDIARRANQNIYHAGMYVFCQRPNIPIPNRFGEESNMFYWFVGKLPKTMISEHNKRHGITPIDANEDAAA